MKFKEIFRRGVIVIVSVMALVIILSLFLGGCRNEEITAPPKTFVEKCEKAKAFRIYKDHNGDWACKLDDGRVYTDK